MDGVMSQEEINALLSSGIIEASSPEPEAEAEAETAEQTDGELLTDQEKDAIGEISNISLGTAATTLFSLVNRKVTISTPVVSYATWSDICEEYERPCVFIRIGYTVGLDGSNIMVLREDDVKVITDLMMGGDGTNTSGDIGELHLSAISEAMNQMMGSASTSMSSMLNKVIDISPPQADLVDLQESMNEGKIDEFLMHEFVKISFRLVIEGLVDSYIMQLFPPDFVRAMCKNVSKNMERDSNKAAGIETEDDEPEEQVGGPMPGGMAGQPMMGDPMAAQMGMMPQGMMGGQPMGGMMQGQPMMGGMMPQGMMGAPMGAPMGQQIMGVPMMGQEMSQMYGQQINVQPAQFQAFSGNTPVGGPENIDLIMDVPLEVTVELGRTSRSIKEILDFAPGTVIELNRIAGEPIDVLVNGKYVAKGEVIIIEESYGIRITEIIK